MHAFSSVRINTYKRLDLLEGFLEYYKDCPYIEETQVVWSDQDEKPPYALYPKDSYPNVFFEEHTINSLNNRFRPLRGIPTEVRLNSGTLCNFLLTLLCFRTLPHDASTAFYVPRCMRFPISYRQFCPLTMIL